MNDYKIKKRWSISRILYSLSYCSYLSRISVTTYLKQPTRMISGYRQPGTKFNHAYLVLLPTGFTFAFPVTKDTGALLPHHFTLTLPRPEIKYTVIICLRLVSLNYINIVFGILPFKYYLHILIFTYQ